MAPAPASEASYRKDEKVFCFHHELLYEAKVTDVKPNEGEDKKSGFQYKVHYKGWKNTYVIDCLLILCLPQELLFAVPRTEEVTNVPRPHFGLEVSHFNITAQQRTHRALASRHITLPQLELSPGLFY